MAQSSRKTNTYRNNHNSWGTTANQSWRKIIPALLFIATSRATTVIVQHMIIDQETGSSISRLSTTVR